MAFFLKYSPLFSFKSFSLICVAVYNFDVCQIFPLFFRTHFLVSFTHNWNFFQNRPRFSLLCLYLYSWFEFETFPVTWKKIFALLMWLRLILYSSKHKARGEKKTSRRNKSKKKKPKKELSASSISSKRFVCKFSCQFICNFNSRQTMNRRKKTVYYTHRAN